jgi:hypothetical protein
VIEIVKNGMISDEDVGFTEWFARKLILLQTFLEEKIDLGPLFLESGKFDCPFFARVADFFGCQAAEVWRFEKDPRVLIRYTSEAVNEIPTCNGGLTLHSIQTERTLCLVNGRMPSQFNVQVEMEGETCLCILYRSPRFQDYGFLLRGSLH